MTLFRSMTPDRDSTTNQPTRWLDAEYDPGEWVPCPGLDSQGRTVPRCKGGYRTGGWPYCRGEGHEADHMR